MPAVCQAAACCTHTAMPFCDKAASIGVPPTAPRQPNQPPNLWTPRRHHSCRSCPVLCSAQAPSHPCFATLSTPRIPDPKSRWAQELGLCSSMGGTDRSIPPLMHLPPPVVSRVLYGGEGVRGGLVRGAPGDSSWACGVRRGLHESMDAAVTIVTYAATSAIPLHRNYAFMWSICRGGGCGGRDR
jgi:hypothetical protein